MNNESIDWKLFLPAAPLPPSNPNEIRSLPIGAIFVSAEGVARSVREVRDGRYDDERFVELAGTKSWDSGYSRVIRHADGRWADGYGPDGPIDCRDRAAGKAASMVERLAEGWVRLSAPGAHPPGSRCGDGCDVSWRCQGSDCNELATYARAAVDLGACVDCAEQLGVFADAPVTAPSGTGPTFSERTCLSCGTQAAVTKGPDGAGKCARCAKQPAPARCDQCKGEGSSYETFPGDGSRTVLARCCSVACMAAARCDYLARTGINDGPRCSAVCYRERRHVEPEAKKVIREVSFYPPRFDTVEEAIALSAVAKLPDISRRPPPLRPAGVRDCYWPENSDAGSDPDWI